MIEAQMHVADPAGRPASREDLPLDWNRPLAPGEIRLRAEPSTAEAIRAILRRYSVRVHYIASSRPGSTTRYALFEAGKGQVGDTGTHAEIQRYREDLIIADLQQLLGQGSGVS